MNVLAIVATNRRKGTIVNICTQYLSAAKQAGHETEMINLYDHEIKPCIGCWACAGTNKCVLSDDFESIYNRVERADVILLGVPCYWGNVPGVMKNFFDRHTGCAMFKPKNAAEFHSLTTKEKIKTIIKMAKKFGPNEGMGHKRFVWAVTMTAPFPMAQLSGDLSVTLKALNIYTKKLKGKRIGKIVYTDTLFRFRKNKGNRIMQRAYKMGERLT